MFKKLICLSLIVLILFSCSNNVNAVAGILKYEIHDNHWAGSMVEVWDQGGSGWYDKKQTQGARNNYDYHFRIPDYVKWHNIMIVFHHGVSGQGPPDYVTVPSYTGGDIKITFETYGDDIECWYKNLYNHWNDKHRNVFWLGRP